jgi:hypothetical protein
MASAQYGPGKRLKATASFPRRKSSTVSNDIPVTHGTVDRPLIMMWSNYEDGPSGQPMFKGSQYAAPPGEDDSVMPQNGPGYPRGTQYSSTSTGRGPLDNMILNTSTDGVSEGPKFFEKLVLPRQTITQTMGRNTNNRLHTNVDVTIGSMIYDRVVSRFQFVWTKERPIGYSGDSYSPYTLNGSTRLKDVLDPIDIYNLPTANYIAACSASSLSEIPTVQKFLAAWSMVGMIVSDEGAANKDRSRGITFAIGRQGPEETFNIFGNDLWAGTEFGFIVKRMPVPKIYRLDPGPDGPADEVKCLDESPPRPYAFQFIPWASGTRDLMPEDVQYTNPDSEDPLRVHYGAFICLGRVEHRNVDANEGLQASAPFCTAAILGCKPVAVLLDTPSIRFFQ